ncbi:MAG: hypothetical protein H6733_01360 [Alphaproteobacteria bacterium]|nr:hypothetical protein [Alphaproteobacteria bacterium]
MTLSSDVDAVLAADAALAAAGPSPFVLPVIGLEHVVVGTLRALRDGDWWVPGLRERVGAVLREVPLDRLVDGFAGARPYRVAPPTPSPALRALHAVGLALAEPDAAVAVHLGTGSIADGAFAEALNLAALRSARVVFVVGLYDLAGGHGAPVPVQSAAACTALAAAYGVPTTSVDGTDAAAVRDAVAAALGADGPHVVAATLRPQGQG